MQLGAFEQPSQSNSISEKLLSGHFASMDEFRGAHKLNSTIMRAYEWLHQLPISTDFFKKGKKSPISIRVALSVTVM